MMIKLPVYLLLLVLFNLYSFKITYCNLIYYSRSILIAVALWNSAKMKKKMYFLFLSVTSPAILVPKSHQSLWYKGSSWKSDHHKLLDRMGDRMPCLTKKNQISLMRRSRGGGGDREYIGFLAVLDKIPWKSPSYQASIQCWAIIPMPARQGNTI